ncbi:MAG: MraY family glycosyltransferase [Proteobacteria bacterium]|nr:MraY family glycosyltransferase [Pseudomonadota bacterium]
MILKDILIAFFVLTFLLGFAFSYYLTPRFMDLASRFGLVDRPDGRLKHQEEPVPYLGGLAVFLAFLLTLAITYEFSPEVTGILLAGTVIVILGLLDDFGALSPGLKFLGQVVATAVLIKSGIYIKLTFVPVYLAIPLTFLWMIAIINAFNIIDIMDGLSPGTALIASLTLFAVALLNDRLPVAIMTLALAGSLAGFLPYNFHPARVYLGDTGSMFLGLMLGSLGLEGSYTNGSLLGALAPLVILGIPIFDTALVMWVRWRKGLSPFLGSPDHYSLVLKRAGFSVRKIVLVTYLVGIVLGGLGLLLMRVNFHTALVIIGSVGFFFLVGFFLIPGMDRNRKN